MILAHHEAALLGGFSIGKALKKTVKVATVPAKVVGKAAVGTAKVTVKAAKATGNVTADVAKATGSGVVTVAKATGSGIATAGKAVGHGVMVVKRVSERMARKIVRGVVLRNLHGDDFDFDSLLGSDGDKAAKTALKAVVIPAATTAVLASTVAAPAAPLVPVVTPSIIDEAYDTVKKKMAKGKTLAQAVSEAEAEGPPPFYKTTVGMVVIGGSVAAAVVVLARRKRRRGKEG